MKQHILFLTFLSVTLFITNSYAAEQIHLFSGRDLQELALIETNSDLGTFSFIDSSNEIQQGIIGDLIGIEGLTVVEVHDVSITAASYEEYDWYGTTRMRTNTIKIPKARIFDGGKGIR